MELDMPPRRDQVSFGVLMTVVGRTAIDEAAVACGVRAKRSDSKLPPHVTAYLTMGLSLFAGDDYEEVATKVTGSLGRFNCWDAAWAVPTASAITQARKRLGAAFMPELAARVFGPVAGEPGRLAAVTAIGRARRAFACGLRLVAIDGFELDAPDSEANATEFGYAGSGGNRSALPKVRVVTVTECGTHALLDAQLAPYAVGESTLAARMLPDLHPDELLVADRNFYSFTAWCTAADTGAGLAWRAPTSLHLPLVEILPDGTYLSVLVKPTVRGARRDALIAAARDDPSGEDLDCDLARIVRVIEYNVTDRDGSGTGEVITVITTLTDPTDAAAHELAAAYNARWEHENGNDELKTHLRGAAAVLRSRLPELVYQQTWAMLLVHHATTVLIAQASAAADPHPDQISYTDTLRLILPHRHRHGGHSPLRTGTPSSR
jgi:hypothetical protein